jgi:hypothetical protein
MPGQSILDDEAGNPGVLTEDYQAPYPFAGESAK